jgi:hypothetical protein
MQQLHDRRVLDPKGLNKLTSQQRHHALWYLMFLKKQLEYTTKEETSSPMVAIESFMLLCIILDAKEGRDVAAADIPGTFMQTDMEGTVHMVLEGTMAKLLVKVDPKLDHRHLMMKYGKPMMYVQLKKALYGTLEAGLLFWRDLTKNLKKWGFKINPYGWCVANKMIGGKQCTVIWHVDDIKVSH